VNLNNEARLVDEIGKLRKEVERLKRVESGGVWKTWTPTVTGWASISASGYRYVKVGNFVYVMIMIFGVSNSTEVLIDLPFTSTAVPYIGVTGYAMDNGTQSTNPCYAVYESTTKIRVYRNTAGAAWTASGNKRIIIQFGYEVA